MSKPFVLVTGGSGYIGSHTSVALIEAGYDVVIVDNLSHSSYQSIDRIEAITGKSVVFYQSDITDENGMDQIFNQYDFAGVLHFAGLKSVPQSIEQPLAYYHNNVHGTQVLLSVMQAHGVNQIVFSSSATVYGAQDTLPFTEDMTCLPATSVYGTTKQVIEQMLLDAANANAEFTAFALRYFNPIGAHPSGHLGEFGQAGGTNLMPFVLEVASGQREALSVYGDDYDTPDGTCRRDYIHVMDLALGHVRALEVLLEQDEQSEVATHQVQCVNLGSGTPYSVLELVRAFETVNKLCIPIEVTPRRQGDLAEFWADSTKAQNVLGWQAKYTLNDMVKDAWQWHLQHGGGVKN